MYELYYDLITGECIGIMRHNADGSLTSFLKDTNSQTMEEFIIWNSKQKTPLDLNSTIEVVKPVPTRDLVKEIDEIKKNITTIATATKVKI